MTAKDSFVAVDAARRVFVVHGRDEQVRRCFVDFLRSLDLRPLDWEELVARTGATAPFLGDVLVQAPHVAQAVLVLCTPDDIVQLHPDLASPSDSDEDRARGAQVRPNVIFELGQALAVCPERTIMVEIGRLRSFADVRGRNYVKFDGSALAIKKLVERLKVAGCRVDDTGSDWLDLARFSTLAAYLRGHTLDDGGSSVLKLTS
jgi:predicted nucleotide-binding protein